MKQHFKVKELDPKAYKKLVKQFVADYGDVVCRAINKARTTAQSEMKKAFVKAVHNDYFGGGKDSMPTPKELQQVILRKGLIDPSLLTCNSIDPGFMPYVTPDNIRKELDHHRGNLAKLTATEDDSDDETVDAADDSTKPRKRSSRKPKKNSKKPQDLDEDDRQSLERSKKMVETYENNDKVAREKHEEEREKAWKKHCKDKYQRNMKIFVWYWTCLLPAMCRNEQWGLTKRTRGLISFYAPLNNSKDKYITAADEALVGIIYENCGKRFPFLAGLDKFVQEVHSKHVDYQAKWSSSTKGQSKFGGWDEAAVTRFTTIKKLVDRNRKKDSTHLREVESAALDRIQGKDDDENGSVGADDVEEVREKVELPQNFVNLAYDTDGDDEMEEFELEDPDEVYLPVPETKEEKKKKAKASKSG